MKIVYNTAKAVALVAAALIFACTGRAGGADDVLITFSTSGEEPDRYADGEIVMDGECYALVWSSDGVFEGLRADGTPVDPNDKVVLAAAVAKGGHCPEVVFQIGADEAEAMKSGQYGVLLLDTRVNEDGHVFPRGTAGGSLALVNGFGEVAETHKVATSDHVTIDSLLRPEGLVAGENAAVVQGVKQPRIKSIKVVGAHVLLTVENLGGYVHVQGGGAPGALTTLGAATATDGGSNDVVLVVPKVGGAGFYSVQRN